MYECYSRLLLKYFIAEGVMCGHVLVLCSANEDPNNLIQVNLYTVILSGVIKTVGFTWSGTRRSGWW